MLAWPSPESSIRLDSKLGIGRGGDKDRLSSIADSVDRVKFIASLPREFEEMGDTLEFADRTECRDGDRER